MHANNEAVEDNSNKYDKFVQCIIIGDAGVGKSTLLTAIKKEYISGSYITTIGIDFTTTIVKFENSRIKMQIWDTAGEPRFRIITSAYYRRVQIVFLVVSLGVEGQYPGIRGWMREIERNCTPGVTVVLVGRVMRDPNNHTISTEAMQAIAAEFGITYVEMDVTNYEQASQLMTTGLRLLSAAPDLQDASPFVVIENFIPKIAQNCKLEDLLMQIAQLTTREKNAGKLYPAKIKFLEEIIHHIEQHKKFDYLPKILMHYIEAIAGMLQHYPDSTNEIKAVHIPVLIHCISAIDDNVQLQSDVVNEVNEFYSSAHKRLFPHDNNFQPLIACKLMVWSRERSPLLQLKAFYRLPYLGSWQDIIDQIINEMILTVRVTLHNTGANYEHTILEYADLIAEYYLTQKQILKENPKELNFLLLSKLQFLQKCLPPLTLTDSRLWEIFHRLEMELTGCTPELVRKFVIDLREAKRVDETDEEYTSRSILAIFLIQSHNLEQDRELNEEQSNHLRILEIKSFENLCNVFAKLSKNAPTYVQVAVDVLTRFVRLEAFQLKSLKVIIVAAKYLLASPQALDDMDENDLEELSLVLADFMSRHFDIATVVTHFQQLHMTNSRFAEGLCKCIMSKLMEEILATETYEAYLERLSAAVSLTAIYEPMKPHFHARMILLVNAEEVIQKASDKQRLTAKDFHAAYSHLIDKSAEEGLVSFVADRQGFYLQALCRCYRQNVSLAVNVMTLVKQYLIANQSAVLISEDDNLLVLDVIKEQITTKDIISLIGELSQQQLAVLAKIYLPCLSEFILADKIDPENNPLAGPNAHTHKTCHLSEESLEKLALAIVMADKHHDALSDILKCPFRIYNKNVFIVARVFFENLEVSDKNVSLMIDLVDVILKTFFRNASELCFALNEVAYDEVLTQLLQFIPKNNTLFGRRFIPCISNITYHYLTQILPNTNNQQCLDLLLCLIKNGANLLATQTEETAVGRKATHAMLFLLASPQREILKRVLEWYRANPQAIVDSNPNNRYFDENPLVIAICNGGDRQLITLMLELGFSRDVVNEYLTEAYDTKIIEIANQMKKNSEALTALYVFKLKEPQPATALLLKDIKSENSKDQSKGAELTLK